MSTQTYPVDRSYPDGLIPAYPPPDPLTTHRQTSITYELLNRSEAVRGPLDGVEPGGTLTWSNDDKIKGGGKITLHDVGQQIDWLNDRIRIRATVNGITRPLGIWIPTAPGEKWTNGARAWEVELHDKLVVLDQDTMERTYSLAKGTSVTAVVRTLIQEAGESNIAMTESDAVLKNGMTWEAGTSRLTICNDLLDANGYWTLRTNAEGAFVVAPYQSPSARPIAYEFVDGENSIYLGEFAVDQDIFAIPNRVVAVAQGDGEEEGLVGVATNEDPESPFSYQSRGRWITSNYTGVEATSQAAIDSYAHSKLVELANPAQTIGIQHAPIAINLLDAVRFRSIPAGIDWRYVVDSTEMSLDPTALATSAIRRVEAEL